MHISDDGVQNRHLSFTLIVSYFTFLSTMWVGSIDAWSNIEVRTLEVRTLKPATFGLMAQHEFYNIN